MPKLDDDISDLFREAPNEVGLEITVEDEGKRLDLDGLGSVTWDLWWCREYVVAVAAYARHVLDPDGAGGELDPAMAELVAAAAVDDTARIDDALRALVDARVDAAGFLRDGIPYPYFIASDAEDLRIEFAAGVHENPTRLAFLVVGAVVPVTMMVMIVGMSGLYRQYGEPACVKLARETTDRRIEMLTKMHRLEGHMSPPLRQNLDSIIKAGDAAERSCRSLLDRFHYKVTVPPGFTFEIALGDSPSAPSGP